MLEVGLGFLVGAESFIMETGKVCQTQPRINKVLLSQYGLQSESRRGERRDGEEKVATWRERKINAPILGLTQTRLEGEKRREKRGQLALKVKSLSL